ncbi:ABC transporter ATP-binding protein [Neomicrococcus lactis]|uniref:ABC-type multidrug transport system ATPase subunit n=1 Tax=Neomicrococcus lactis TaxID=732241 RepID=A0A7W9DBI5_9MICC|nr:ABC transporter ATP-binding protein [Neomicrococcus lactis]MBB5598564.1 ABC-type multidrug transport system ATPase subunit [Neomicrococcus lactis]
MTTTDAPVAQHEGIRAAGLARAFGDVHAVKNIDFDAPMGQVTALVGPNGSGKTTLLLMLASLLQPDAGTITVNGKDPAKNLRAVRAQIGWMPDTLGVWEQLTVTEVLVMVGQLYGMTRGAAESRAADLLELVQLTELAKRPSGVLSRGQQQRLSLARALVHDPQILLLDEPASGLDPGARIDLRNLIRRLADTGRAVVISSHVLSELDEMADRAVFIADGRTVDVQSIMDAGAQSRRYALTALDDARLRTALEESGTEFGEVRRQQRLEFVVRCASEHDAAALLSRLVSAGIPITQFAPATGALEESYVNAMAKNVEERS